MIDNFAILFSTLAVVVAIYRAVRLDADRPWFKPWDVPDERGVTKGRRPPATPPWRRR